MTGDVTFLEQQLAANPFAGLELIIRRFPDGDHYGVIEDAFRDGMLKLFARSSGFVRTSLPSKGTRLAVPTHG